MLAMFFTLASAVLALVLFLSHSRNKARPLNLPPGKMGLPFIGETLGYLMANSVFANGKFMDERIAKYGKICKTNLFARRIIFSADAELNKFVMQNEGRLFESCYPSNITAVLGRWTFLNVVGDLHKQFRSIAVNFVSSTKLRTHLIHDAETQALLVLKSWKVGETISGRYEATRFTFNFMVKNIFSLEPGQHETEMIRKSYVTFMKGIVSLPIDLPGTAYRKALKSRSDILEIFEKIMNKRIQKANGDSKKVEDDDLLGWVMKHSTLPTNQTMDLLLSMLFGGYDTTSLAISLAIYYLHEFPRALQELREENIRIIEAKKHTEDSKLNWKDYKQMEFTQCLIKEVLRLGNIAPFLYRKAIKDVHYKGYDIPCGWNVVVILSFVHLDPSIFEKPQEFNPWRWKDGNVKIEMATNHNPFGGGNRLCPGYELAKVEMAVFLHHLVLHYNWEATEPDHPLSDQYVEFPKGLPIKVHNYDFLTMKA